MLLLLEDEVDERRCEAVGTGGGGICRDARSTGEGEEFDSDELVWSRLGGIAEGGANCEDEGEAVAEEGW